MDPAEENSSKTVDIYRDTWVRFLGMYSYMFASVVAEFQQTVTEQRDTPEPT